MTDPNVYNEAKRYFVEHGKSIEEIHELIGGAIAVSTLYAYAAKKDRDEKTWRDLRDEHRDALYHAMSPERLVEQLFREVQEIITTEKAGAKKADAIHKMLKSAGEIAGPRLQLPVMYHLLEQLVLFLRASYPQLLSAELIGALRDFKGTLRTRLGVDQ